MTKKRRKQLTPVPRGSEKAYRQLVQLVEAPELDVQRVQQLLVSNPVLLKVLDGVRNRELARQEALTRPDIALASPTQDFPRGGESGFPAAWTGARNYPIGVSNARVLRQLADTDPWVRAAITVRRQQIGRADIAVVPLNERKPYSRTVMKKVQHLLDQPNEYRDSYRSLIEPVLEDVLVLDRGVITKNMTIMRQPVGLYYEDGATIKIYPQWSGDPNEPRYLYEDDVGRVKKPLRNDECIVIMANPASYRYGLSPVQVLYETIQADLKASTAAMHMVDMKPPPHAVQVPGATEAQITRLRMMYDTEIAGRKEVFWFGGNNPANHFPLIFSAKDNQWLEWQVYIVRKMSAVFQLSPQQLGVTFDINKANAEVQQEIFEDTGLIPLLLLLEEFLNRELLADYAQQLPNDRSNLAALNLRIVYPEVSEAARQLHAERAVNLAAKGMAGLPSMTLNQVLAMRGEEPVAGGDAFYVNTTAGPLKWLSYGTGYLGGDYGPRSGSGVIGAQDPASGTSEDADSPSTTPADDDPTSSGPPPVLGELGQPVESVQVGSKSFAYTRSRPPGKRWTSRYTD